MKPIDELATLNDSLNCLPSTFLELSRKVNEEGNNDHYYLNPDDFSCDTLGLFTP